MYNLKLNENFPFGLRMSSRNNRLFIIAHNNNRPDKFLLVCCSAFFKTFPKQNRLLLLPFFSPIP